MNGSSYETQPKTATSVVSFARPAGTATPMIA